MRVLPNLTVEYPSCELDTREAVRQLWGMNCPCYIGLGRKPANYEPTYTREAYRIGKAIRIRDGADAAIFAMGVMVPVAASAAELLAKDGIQMSVYNMHTLKPLDTEAIAQAASGCGAVFTLEEESIIGGLGGAVAEYLAENTNLKCRFKRLGINDRYLGAPGTEAWMQQQYGIDAEGVEASVRSMLRQPQSRLARRHGAFS
jgi:transketolase